MPTIESEPRRPRYQVLLAAYDRARGSYERDPSSHTLAILETGFTMLVQELHRPGAFGLGQLVMTVGAQEAMRDAGQVPLEFLLRHKNQDWGELPPEDIQENAWSLEHGARLFSRYTTRRDDALYVITECDRSLTTILTPEEY
jgi:hypothetical protein